MNKILTITIPTYNMEKYLRRCLDSLIIDKELMERLEVLVVNDGSKDTSSAIAHEYEKKYPHTFRVIDKENGNYGSCVNRGLMEATGKYFRLLDSDDWFDTKAFAIFVEKLLKFDVDMVLTSYNTIYTNNGTTVRHPFNKGCLYDKIYDLPETNLYDFIYPPVMSLPMHDTTYSMEILKRSKLRHDEGISYTDMEYVYIPLQYVKKFVVFDLELYQYYIGREGQTMDPESRKKHVGDLYKVIETLSPYHFTDIEQRHTNLLNVQRGLMQNVVWSALNITLLQIDKKGINIYKDKLNAILSITKRKDPVLYSMVNRYFRHVPVLWFWEKFEFASPRFFSWLIKLATKLGNVKNKLLKPFK